MSSYHGENIHLSIFGSSHDPAIGMTLEGVPSGFPIDFEYLYSFLKRRAPGINTFSSTRKEPDHPEFIVGIKNGRTTGSAITAQIQNQDVKSSDYVDLKYCPRPGHADFTAFVKYGGKLNMSGGGPFSGRLTAPLCVAGGLCKQWLGLNGIHIAAHIYKIGKVSINTDLISAIQPNLNEIPVDFPVIDPVQGERMKLEIQNAKEDGDSVGGVIQCITTGLPIGLGDAMFDGMESRIAQMIFGIPAVKGISFGSGFSGTSFRGSINNDAYCLVDGQITTQTNHAGGILGGITNGMPLIFDVAVKPTPSIAKPQQSINLATMTETEIKIKGRHDPCIVPRAVPVVEAAAAIAIFDAWLSYIGGNNDGSIADQE